MEKWIVVYDEPVAIGPFDSYEAAKAYLDAGLMTDEARTMQLLAPTMSAPERAAFNNKWDLYESVPQFAEAHAALEAAWDEAKNLPTPLDAYNHVEKVMRKYRDAGAGDTEPRYELTRRIRIQFKQPDWC